MACYFITAIRLQNRFWVFASIFFAGLQILYGAGALLSNRMLFAMALNILSAILAAVLVYMLPRYCRRRV